MVYKQRVCAAGSGRERFASTPSGTRYSTYENQEYLDACDFAEPTFNAINSSDAENPCLNEVPYTGNSLPNLPEYSAWGTTVAEQLAAYISGSQILIQQLRPVRKQLTVQRQKAVTETNCKL